MPSIPQISLKDQLEAVIECQRVGQDRQGILKLQSIIKQYPGHSRPYFLLGLSYVNLGKYEEAMDPLSRAIAIQPSEAEYHGALGVVLAKTGKKSLAVARWKAAIRLNDQRTDPYFNIGDALMDDGKAEEAIPYFKQAVTLKPDFHEAWNNLGLCHKALKQLPSAQACFDQAIRLKEEHPDYHLNRAMAHLAIGEYLPGWQKFEWRFKRSVSPLAFSPPDGVPLWQGESLTGRHLLVLSEQGFGDTLQFVRFLAVLKQQGATLTLMTPNALVSLLTNRGEIDHVTADKTLCDDSLDFYIPLMSIPHRLGTTRESIPQTFPYLTPSPDRLRQWQAILPPAEMRVGLVWEGNLLFQNDPLRRRSTTLAALAPLAQRKETLFVSLQVGEPARQALHPPEGMWVLDVSAGIRDFDDTAALIQQLDLLITIDTATAHLGGGLGRPTWVLLPYAPDWRWGLASPQTPWYPNTRLFRQTEPNQWQEPIQQMAELLLEWSSHDA